MTDPFAPLRARGLDVIGVLPLAEAASVAPSLADASGFTSVVVVGSTGTAMWTSIQANGFGGEHPVNDHAAWAVKAFADAVAARGGRTRAVWPPPPDGPEQAPLPVTKLGELAGWGRRSPLGIGMHPRFGVWVGYRAVILVDGDWDPVREPPAPHPCDACEAKPCVSACPASAIGATKGIRADPCFAERLREGAACNDRCLSRLACPVGVEHRYSPEQLAYHQRYGNGVYHRWRATQP